MNISGNSNTAASQRKRIMEYLRIRPLDTITARLILDVLHPAGRIMELRKSGVPIETVMIEKESDCGKIHSVTCYVLMVGTVAAAPTCDSAENHWIEIDMTKHSIGGGI